MSNGHETLANAMWAAREQLASAGVEQAPLDARLLAGAACGLDAGGLVVHAQRAMTPAEGQAFDVMVARRLDGEPVARILGRREFWGMDFALGPETLVPRPDSETVVEVALAVVDGLPGGRTGAWRIADLGTGSGCLIVALLAELANATGVATDASVAALRVARSNARANGIGDRCAFVAGDWMAPLPGPFDVIVSNPPYVESEDIVLLAREVVRHEPRMALDGGADGLSAYRAIVPQAPSRLAPGGALVLEVGAGQAGEVARIATSAGLADCATACDLAGVERVVIARRPCNGDAQKPLGKQERTR